MFKIYRIKKINNHNILFSKHYDTFIAWKQISQYKYNVYMNDTYHELNNIIETKTKPTVYICDDLQNKYEIFVFNKISKVSNLRKKLIKIIELDKKFNDVVFKNYKKINSKVSKMLFNIGFQLFKINQKNYIINLNFYKIIPLKRWFENRYRYNIYNDNIIFTESFFFGFDKNKKYRIIWFDKLEPKTKILNKNDVEILLYDYNNFCDKMICEYKMKPLSIKTFI